MLRNIVIGLLVAFSLVTTPMAIQTHTIIHTKPDYSQIRQATRLLYIDGLGNGSGVMIAPNRMITANHVAERDSDLTPLMLGVARVKVLKTDPVNDLALLEVQANCPCVSIGNIPRVDTPVALVGFPSNNTLQTQIVTLGTYQGITTIGNKVVATAPGSPGNSGGGLFYNKDGKWYLFGVLIEGAGTVIGGMYPQMVFHLAMSVHPDYIKKLLK